MQILIDAFAITNCILVSFENLADNISYFDGGGGGEEKIHISTN